MTRIRVVWFLIRNLKKMVSYMEEDPKGMRTSALQTTKIFENDETEQNDKKEKT